ncbi:hypothetical protein FN846DRAFT_903737 [Sphaerosporella brunnea]|uniref:Uncharacterized protein n=1 Tax=Sphaerosporella brunnea TaxID=1250544 RepID=A0A5J5F671_9PEZI|nr:hypothetical protein FN846DRAFT_903737 [Sphaerosporella brunnea]
MSNRYHILQLVKNSAVALEVSTTEALVLTARKEATPPPCLRVFLDSKLTLTHHHNVRMGKARAAGAEVQRVGRLPENFRRIKIAAVQSGALYEIVNRQARTVLIAHPATALGQLICEVGLTDASSILSPETKLCREAFSHPQRATEDSSGPAASAKVSVTTARTLMRFVHDNAFGNSAPTSNPATIMVSLAEAIPSGDIEPTTVTAARPPGRTVVSVIDEAAASAVMQQRRTNGNLTVYSDGSRREDERCGYAAVMQAERETNMWSRTAKHIGENNAVYDAELFRLAHGRPQGRYQDLTYWSRPETWMLPRLVRAEAALKAQAWTEEFHWTPGRADISRNEPADSSPKKQSELD